MSGEHTAEDCAPYRGEALLAGMAMRAAEATMSSETEGSARYVEAKKDREVAERRMAAAQKGARSIGAAACMKHGIHSGK